MVLYNKQTSLIHLSPPPWQLGEMHLLHYKHNIFIFPPTPSRPVVYPLSLSVRGALVLVVETHDQR